MIRPRYALKLARTKLRSKRGMLTTSIIVASLSFAVLVATVIIFGGVEKSSSEFIKKAGNDRYLVRVSPVIPYDKLSFGAELSINQIREIKAFEKSYYETQRAKYKSLNLTYDASTEIPALEPASWLSTSLPEEQRVTVNRKSPIIIEMETQKYADYAKTATNTFNDLRLLGNKYNASGYYAESPSLIPSIPSTRLIEDNKEDFGSSMKTGDASSYGYFINAAYNSQYSFVDDRILNRYLLPQSGRKQKGIPVIISAQEAVSLFGTQLSIGEEPKDVSMKSLWLKDLQTKINGQTYQACYRNTTEQSMLAKIQSDYAEIKNNEQNQNYTKPSLIYNYPVTVCGDITIKSDTRTPSEKSTDNSNTEKQKKLGLYVAPEHQLLTFQIVGVIYARPYTDYSANLGDYVKNLLTPQQSSLSAIIPQQLYSQLPSELKVSDFVSNEPQYATLATNIAEQFYTRILEFNSIENARAFMSNETCSSIDTACAKRFSADPYGSNYLILDQVATFLAKVTTIAFPVVLGFSAIIIWFTISRIMADNRKETAVYRAMGAKRIDITAIYGIYILLIALQIVLLSIILGFASAYLIDLVYSPQLTSIAAAAFGIIEGSPRFSLFSPTSPLILCILLSIIVVSIVASLQPLIRNVLRPPIQDMREE